MNRRTLLKSLAALLVIPAIKIEKKPEKTAITPSHIPTDEVIKSLPVRPWSNIVSVVAAERIKTGQLVCIDHDGRARLNDFTSFYPSFGIARFAADAGEIVEIVR